MYRGSASKCHLKLQYKNNVAIWVCGRLGMWPFRFVLIKGCGRLGVWSLRFVAISVCYRCGLWSLRLWPFRLVVIFNHNSFMVPISSSTKVCILKKITQCSNWGQFTMSDTCDNYVARASAVVFIMPGHQQLYLLCPPDPCNLPADFKLPESLEIPWVINAVLFRINDP